MHAPPPSPFTGPPPDQARIVQPASPEEAERFAPPDVDQIVRDAAAFVARHQGFFHKQEELAGELVRERQQREDLAGRLRETPARPAAQPRTPPAAGNPVDQATSDRQREQRRRRSRR